MSDKTNKTNDPAVKTWAKTLAASEKARVSAEASGKKATALLWDGAVGAITEWDQSGDPDGNELYEQVKTALGGDHRKGDASKIRTVAMAVANHNLDIDEHPSLSKAYNAARDLMKGEPQRNAEDAAAEAVTSAITPPSEPSTPEDAAKILLAEGVDETARLLVAAMGRDNGPAHRSMVRAIASEVAAVSKAVANEKKEAEKEQREADKAEAAAKIETAKAEKAEAKAKPAPVKKSATTKKAEPVSASKGDPNKKALPPKKAAPKKAAPVKAKPVETSDMDDLLDEVDETPVQKAAPKKAAPKKAAPAKAKPVRRPVRATK